MFITEINKFNNMKQLFVLLLLLTTIYNTSASDLKINYTDLLNNSKFVSINNSIIIGFTASFQNKFTESDISVTVNGSESGIHSGEIILLHKLKRIIFKPSDPFNYNENVTVSVKFNTNINTVNNIFKLAFTTEKQPDKNRTLKNKSDFYSYDLFNSTANNSLLNSDLPELTVTINNSPAEGKIFLSNFPFSAIPSVPHLIIADNSGEVYSGIRVKGTSLDFKKEPNGNLVYFNTNVNKYYELNREYELIDSFYCGNGYITDGHELRILNNEHALLMSYDSQTVDMSQLVPGGNPNCLVIGLVIQEIDAQKNVIFQWRSWDAIPITEAQHQNMTDSYLDYIHGNAIELDNDGNILISSRHLDEITKINRETGQIMWRLGGPANEFTFINDPDKFNYQHGIRRLPNGNIILFDNGNFHTPPRSRAVEYAMDEVNKTATLVWQYRNTPDNFGFAMGFAQRLDNGNTLISWGSTNPTLTEVTPDGKIALEMSLPQGIFSYRAFKFPWEGKPLYIDLTAVKIPTAYRLKQNYPNPFNPVTKIDFDLPENAFVNLSIYDVLGKVVKNVYNTDLQAGPYSVSFSSTDLPSGVYFYKLTSNNFTETKKMVIIK